MGLGGKLGTQGGEIKLEATFASRSVLIVGGSASLNASVKGHPRGVGLREATGSARLLTTGGKRNGHTSFRDSSHNKVKCYTPYGPIVSYSNI